jgi:Rrf2 family protein
MRITHKVDYGIRVMTSLAVLGDEQPGKPISRAFLAERDSIPSGFIDDILRLLRNGSLVRSYRGAEGGWTLARPAKSISVADVIRVLEGPIASVRGLRPHELPSQGVPEPFVSLWIALRASMRTVLEHVTIADLASGKLPPKVAKLAQAPDAWDDRTPPRLV